MARHLSVVTFPQQLVDNVLSGRTATVVNTTANGLTQAAVAQLVNAAMAGAGNAAQINADTDGRPYIANAIGGLVPVPVTVAAGTRSLLHSTWAQPLPYVSNPASTSSDMVNRLVTLFNAKTDGSTTPTIYYGTPYNTTTEDSAYAICIYYVPTGTTRRKVRVGDTSKSTFQTVCDAGVPIPDPTPLPDGKLQPSGTDGSIIIICGYEAWELWQFSADTGHPGYTFKCQSGGYIADYRTHPGWWSGSSFFGGGSGGRPLGYDWGISAAGMSYLATTLKFEDWNNPAITHPLGLALPITGPDKLLPATRNDAVNFTASTDSAVANLRVPEGARFRLPNTFDIAGWVAAHALAANGDSGSDAATLTKILTCLRDYGVIITDSAGVMGFGAEGSKAFGTAYHPAALDETIRWGNFGQQVPWSSLIQVRPHVYDISVPQGTPATQEPFHVRSWTAAVGMDYTDRTPAWPYGVKDGDTVYAIAAQTGTADTSSYAAPAGWTRISYVAGTNYSTMQVYRRIYHAGDVAPTWPSMSGTWTMGYVAVCNVNAATPEDAAPTTRSDYVNTVNETISPTVASADTITLLALLWGDGNSNHRIATPAAAGSAGGAQLFDHQQLKVQVVRGLATGTNPVTTVYTADIAYDQMVEVAVVIRKGSS